MTRDEFEQHAIKFYKDTVNLSSPTTKRQHPSYDAIVAAGTADKTTILPWLFELQMFGCLHDPLNMHKETMRTHWFSLICAIEGRRFWPDGYAGKVPVMSAYTIVWGVENGYIADNSNMIESIRADQKARDDHAAQKARDDH